MMSGGSSGVMSPCLTASLTSAINAGSSLRGQLGSPQKGRSVVWMMGSSIRTRKGCWCCFCIVCTPWTPALTMRSTREYGIIIVRTRGAERTIGSQIAGMAWEDAVPASAPGLSYEDALRAKPYKKRIDKVALQRHVLCLSSSFIELEQTVSIRTEERYLIHG